MLMPSVQTEMFRHGGVTLCRFRCPAGHDRWQRENRINDGHNIVFPELPVEIRPADHPGVLADPNLAVFYNNGDPYRRELVHPDGDSANIFLFADEHLMPALAPFDPDPDPDRPLSMRVGRVETGTFLKQRLLLARVSRRPAPDPGWVVEQAVMILEEVLAAAYGEPMVSPGECSSTMRRQRERVEQVKRLLFRYFAQPISLPQLADSVETSVYHLCRIFRCHTGQTINGYLQRLRQREGLASLEKTDTPLADLALDVGYAHQSHFTAAFRREYGLPPGELRRQLNSSSLRA